MSDGWTAAQVREDWHKARRRAFWSAIIDTFRGRSNELMPFEEVKTRVNVRGSRYRGLQHVPLDQIVGSEGRYSDFDRRFLPRQEGTKWRWLNIDTARYNDVPLPPVELYKIGQVYFVKDGNHRVSVARQLGQLDIDAYVTEYEVDVPLDPTLSMRDLLITEEYSDFLDWTNLARLRPDQRIKLSALGGYLELIQHINTHRYFLSLEQQAEIPAEDAIVSWYDTVYMPVIDVIREHNILNYFPGRTEADLYLWIMSHRSYLKEFSGIDPGPKAAVLDYADQFGQRGLFGRLGVAAQVLREAARDVVESITPPPLELLDFVEWSHIDIICPDADVRLSEPQDYARLRKHIVDHCYFLGKEWNREVPLAEAVEHWCEHLYSPITAAIREQHALEQFPGHTISDLFLWITDHLHFRKREGVTLDSQQAVVDFVELYGNDNADGQNALAGLLTWARRLVTGEG